MPSTRTRRILLLPLTCLLLGTGLSALLAIRARESEAERVQSVLHRSAAPVAAALQRVLDRHVEVVQSVAGLFHASDRVTREEFREFTRGPLLAHPSIQALEWIPRVPHAERDAFEGEVRNEGIAGFAIREIAGRGRLEPASSRDEYFPVTFVEPRMGNRPAFGLDLAAEPTRRAALLEAMEAVDSVATAPIRLVQGTGEDLGILLFHPVQSRRRDAAEPGARRVPPAGFALGVFRTEGLLAEALQSASSEGLDLCVRDETDPARPAFLFASRGHEHASDARTRPSGGALSWSTTLNLPGRRWTVDLSLASGHSLGHSSGIPRAWQTFGAGFAFTLLVVVSLFALTRRSLRIEALAEDLGRSNRVLEEEVAERRRVEESLRTSESNYRALFEAEPDAIILVDLDGREIVDANPSVTNLYGYSHDELCGMPAERLSAQRDQTRAHIETIVREARGGPVAPIGYRLHRRKDGTEFRVEISHGFYVRDGRPLICAILRDITERERAESALRESEERFREMADHLEEVFWLFDRLEHRVIYASPAFETIWGRSVADLRANYGEWSGSIHPEDRAEVGASFARMLESGGGESKEYRIVRPDGEVRWISDRAFPVRDPGGQIVRIAGIAEDITDRKTREEEHRLLHAKMQHAQKLESLGVLAGGIAHDFNNLLMSVLGNADLAMMKLAPEAPSREYVEKIGQAAERAAELTNQLLAYSGRGRFVVRAIQVNRLVREMGHLLETVISKKASLEFHLAPDLPSIKADASQIRQVVMNLITNASEALGEETGTIRVSTGVVDADRAHLGRSVLGDELPEGEYVSLEVSDAGCGMEPETRRRIFDPFFTTKFTGRGLGLAAILGIVRGHGGAIEVVSEPGRGSAFKVLFPASGAEPPDAEEVPPEAEPRRKGATILVVDDDPGVLEVARTMLEQSDYRVLTAGDGSAGVEAFRQHRDRVALVLLDMTMPGMNGEEAFREMRRIRGDVRVILSSGYTEQEATNRFAGKELAGFVQKPYRSSRLLDKISDALDR